MPLTAAEWLSENSERQELAVMNIPLAMELYAAYVTSFVPDDVEKEIEQKYPILYTKEEKLMVQGVSERDMLEMQQNAARYGASLAGRMEAVRFAEWILKTEFKKDEDICFRAYKGTGSHQFTVTELYSIFKKESNGK